MIDRACISLNSRCNLRCSYCHFNDKKKALEDKSEDILPCKCEHLMQSLFKYIDASSLNVFKLGIVGAGEPLLNYECIQVIVNSIKTYPRREKIKVYCITNGTLLNDNNLSFFYKNRDIIDLNFSLDGYQELNDLYRSAFNIVYENMKKYKKLFSYMPKVNCVITSDSILNQDKLLDFFIDNDILKVDYSKVFSAAKDISIQESEYNAFLIKSKERGIFSRQNSNIEKLDCIKYGSKCAAGITNIFITKSGIYPCARFINDARFNIGDIDTDFFLVEKALCNIKKPTNDVCLYELYHNL